MARSTKVYAVLPSLWTLALVLAGSQTIGCDLKTDPPSESAADSTTGVVKGATNSSSAAPNDAKKDDSGEKKPDEAPKFEVVAHRVKGSACKTGDGANTTAIVTNSKPNGPTDYGQWVFDAFEVNDKDGSKTNDCTITLELKWTPGYRLRLDSTQLNGFVSNSPPEENETQRALQKDEIRERKSRESLLNGIWRSASFQFSNQTPVANEILSDSEVDSVEFTENGAFAMRSDCSGQGQWIAKLALGVSKDSKSQYSLSYDAFSVAIDGLEKCP